MWDIFSCFTSRIWDTVNNFKDIDFFVRGGGSLGCMCVMVGWGRGGELKGNQNRRN